MIKLRVPDLTAAVLLRVLATDGGPTRDGTASLQSEIQTRATLNVVGFGECGINLQHEAQPK